MKATHLNVYGTGTLSIFLSLKTMAVDEGRVECHGVEQNCLPEFISPYKK
jgi:hypothetical protein